MSQLKEQWGNLMKTRSGGSHSPLKSAFVSAYKPTFSQHVPGLSGVSDIIVKPEFEAFRAKVQNRMAELESISIGIRREAPPAAAKQFMFGINARRAQETTMPERKAKPTSPGPAEAKTIDHISRLQEPDRRLTLPDSDQWEFQISSVAHKSSLGPYVENPDKDLTLTADLGPVARQAAALRPDDLSSPRLQTVEIDPNSFSDDRTEFADVANFALGRIPKKRVLERFRVAVSTEKTSKVLSILIDTPQSSTSPVNQGGEKSLSPKETAHGKSKSVVPELFSRAQDSFVGVNRQQLEGEVELRIAELMTTIRDSDGDRSDKVQRLLDQFHKDASAARSEHERLKARLLIQFLQEYQRVKEARSGHAKKPHLKPAVPKVKRTPKSQAVPPALDPSVYYYSPHNSGRAKATAGEQSFPVTAQAGGGDTETGSLVMRQGWSTSTRPSVLHSKYSPLKHDSPSLLSPLNSSAPAAKRSYANATAASTIKAAKKQAESDPPTLWIGGSKHKDEFDDPNWISPAEEPGKRKGQPRQTRDKQGATEGVPIRSVTPV